MKYSLISFESVLPFPRIWNYSCGRSSISIDRRLPHVFLTFSLPRDFVSPEVATYLCPRNREGESAAGAPGAGDRGARSQGAPAAASRAAAGGGGGAAGDGIRVPPGAWGVVVREVQRLDAARPEYCGKIQILRKLKDFGGI